MTANSSPRSAGPARRPSVPKVASAEAPKPAPATTVPAMAGAAAWTGTWPASPRSRGSPGWPPGAEAGRPAGAAQQGDDQPADEVVGRAEQACGHGEDEREVEAAEWPSWP